MSELMYKNFVKETLDEKGNLKDIIFDYPESFNFAYDVVDSLAKSKPNKKAIPIKLQTILHLWVSAKATKLC